MTQPLSYGLAGAPAQSLYYKHTGRVTATGLLVTILVGLPAAVLAGVVYAYADLYIPLVYLNALLAVGFGVGLGALCGSVLRWGKVRNVPVSLGIIVMLAAVAYYACWVAWVCGVIDRYGDPGDRDFGMVDLAVRPGFLWELVERVNEVGTWSLGRSSSSSYGKTHNTNVSGAFLSAIWLAEAAAIFGGAVVIGRKLAGDLPFCEACDRWSNKPRTIVTTAPGDVNLLRSELEAGRYDYLAHLYASPKDGGATWWEVQHHRCGGCQAFHTITVVQATRTVDKKGNETIARRSLVHRLVVSAEQLQAMRYALGFDQAQPEQQPSFDIV
ncbi:MAG TPA: hypothetical protein VF796_06775 [Humisphaera sp.]